MDELIRADIRARGPLPFSRFMELALYHPELGYYRQDAGVFGREGDFYTAAQLQPVFGRLLTAAFQRLDVPASTGGRMMVADWGAGRSDLRESLAAFDYRAVDVARDELPERFSGVVLANELFDALPVDVARREEGVWRELRVGMHGDGFAWTACEPLVGEWLDYAQRATAGVDWELDRPVIELPVALRDCVRRIDGRLERGWIVAFDYGYTQRELARFPQGTLMGYRRHRAFDDVLAEPGARDITAHVPFDELRRVAAEHGWVERGFESMARYLMSVGERDQFAAVLSASSEAEALRLRLQLKTLLFDIGEMFRAVVWEKS
jgi:SAM-dependent MidA family methyltransferase